MYNFITFILTIMANVDEILADHRHLFNRLDNQGFYSAIIIANPVLSRLRSRHLNLGPFTGNSWTCLAIPAMCHIMTYVRYRMKGDDEPDMDKVMAGAMSESLGPGLPDAHYYNERDTRGALTNIDIWIRDHIYHLSDLIRATAGRTGRHYNNIICYRKFQKLVLFCTILIEVLSLYQDFPPQHPTMNHLLYTICMLLCYFSRRENGIIVYDCAAPEVNMTTFSLVNGY